jgi:hypothetical protein
MKRREFLTTSLAASAVAGLGTGSLNAGASESGAGAREFYELRAYRLKPGANHDLLDGYLEKAAIPAWNRLGVSTVGVFTEPEPKGAPTVYVLLPYPSLEVFHSAASHLSADPEYLKAGAAHLETPKANPSFERLDSWLLLAFAGMPRLELPVYCKEKKPRIMELRTYESHSESKAAKKIDMFNSGEINVMREVGLAPIFYGQALIGPNLPHLTYMLSGENRDLHKDHWGGFGKHADWKKLNGDPQYADTVSKISNWFLTPTSYSQI